MTVIILTVLFVVERIWKDKSECRMHNVVTTLYAQLASSHQFTSSWVLVPGVSFHSYISYTSWAFPHSPETRPASLQAQSTSASDDPENWHGRTSENITPVWAINPHMPAAALYSSSPTQRLWPTGITLVRYAITMISHVIHAQCLSVCEHICQVFNEIL